MSELASRIESFRALAPPLLVEALTSGLAGEDWLGAADHARGLAVSDLGWSGRLAEALCVASPAESAGRARALIAKAHVAAYRGEALKALATLSEVEALARPRGLTFEHADALIASVQPLFLLGRFDEAAAAASRAREIFLAAGLAERAAMAGANLAGVLRRIGRPAEALRHFDEARRVLAGDAVRRAMIDSNRAEVLLDLDEYSEALAAFESALSTLDALESWHAAALVEGNIADLRSRQGRPELALKHFEMARRRFERVGADVEAESARLLAEEAECLFRIGAWSDSATRFEAAVRSLDQIKLEYEAARVRLHLGVLHRHAGDEAAARGTLLEARRRFSAIGVAEGVADADLAIASVDLRGGNAIAAIQRLTAALESSAHGAARHGWIASMLALALVQAGDADAAEPHYEAALRIAEQIQLTPLMARALHAKGVALAARGDFARATEWLEEATRLIERMHAALPWDRYRYAFMADEQGLYQSLCDAALKLGGNGGAAVVFDALERLSARGLLDLVSADDSPDTADRSPEARRLLAELSDCRDSISLAYSRIGLEAAADGADGQSPSTETTDRLNTLEQRHEALEARLRTVCLIPRILSPPDGMEQVCRQLPPDTALVRYFARDDRFAAITVRSSGVQLYPDLARREDMARLADRFEFIAEQVAVRLATGVAAPTLAPWAGAMRELRETLIDPLAAELDGAERIGLILADELFGIPVHHAVAERSDSELRSCVYVPSATIGVRLPRAAVSGAPRLLAVGISDETAPAMRHEAAEIAASWSNSATLLGDRATIAAFMAAARSADVLHLATHCVFSAANPNSSRLMLADGWLDARTLARMRLPGTVVVLAGCETGRSDVDLGVERVGLTRAFLAAGASAVVVSQWPLADAVSRPFFALFYERLLGGMGCDPAVALAQAQRAFAREDIHPVLWTGVSAVGGVKK